MRKPGFTLIELIVVIVIIVILATLSVWSYIGYKARSRLSRVSYELSDLAKSVTQYVEDNNYQYPADASGGVPPGLEKYLQGGVWPVSVYPHGVFDWDNITINGQQIYQLSYRLCDTVANPSEPLSDCADPVLFPHFTQYSSIYYCIFGPCVPHQAHPTDPGYCVNCTIKPQNPPV